MLNSEDQLNASDEILLTEAHLGFAYQVGAAISRLEKKLTALFASPADFEKAAPLKMRQVTYSFQNPIPFESNALSQDTYPIKNFILSFNQALSKNTAPSREELNSAFDLCENLFRKNPEMHLIALFPQSTPSETILKFFNIRPEQSTFFICPLLFGMRDHFVFDYLLGLEPADAARLAKPFQKTYQVPMSYIVDTVGFVVTCLGRPQYQNKIIEVPANFINPFELASQWIEFSESNATAFQKLLGLSKILENNPLEDFLSQNKIPQDTATKQDSKLPTVKALEIFPTALTSTPRLIKSSLDSKNKYPELSTHFPPAKSL